MQNIEYFNFDCAFIGADGVDSKFGYTTSDLSAAFKIRKIIEKSQEVHLFLSFIINWLNLGYDG